MRLKRKRRVRKSQNIGQFGFEKLEPRNLLAGVSPDVVRPVEFVDVTEVAAEQTGQEQDVRNHLNVNHETSHLQQGGSDLQLIKVEHGLDRTITYFQQTYQGTPVFDAFVAVVQGPNGQFQQVLNNGVQEFSKFELTGANLGTEQATQIAETEISSHLTDSSTSVAEDVWFLAGSRVRKAFQVNTFMGETTSNDARGEYQNVIDTHTGNILLTVKPESLSIAGLEADSNVHPRIVINDTIGPAGSRAYAAPFDAVVELSVGCTGTLIAPDVVLSARHCGGGPGSSVRFGDSTTTTYTGTVSSVTFPDGGGSLLDGGDVAIWTLTADVPSNIATPMRLTDEGSALVGEVAATLGYGFNGVGSTGHQFTADGWRWGGENIIDVYGSPANQSGSNIFSTDFDNGSGAANTIGGSDPSPLQFEATTAPGDSGGPLLVQANNEWVIAGVLSGGTTSTSVYGDISWWTGIGDFAAEIEAAGGIFVGSGRGTVNLDSTFYQVDDTVEVTVTDANPQTPIEVTITSDSGDSETFTLTADSATSFSDTIDTSPGAVVVDDGVLQVSLQDVITVTYIDPDDGNGGMQTHTDSADILNKVFYPSGDVPIDINDLQTIFSDLDITDAGNINDLDVQLDITHTWDADLEVFLNAPDGTRVELFSDVGDDGNNFTNTILDDEATVDIDAGSAPFTGSFRPEGDLSVFDDMDINGTWTLEIFDDANADQGRLNAWGIFADITPEIEDVTLAANSFTQTAGNAGSGNLGSLEFSDNADLVLQRNPASFDARTQFEVTANSPILNPVSFDFTIEGSVFSRANIVQTIELFDYNSSTWVEIDSRNAARFSDSVVTASGSGDLSRFVDSNGDVETRLTFQSSSARSLFSSNTDQVFWDISG